MLEGEEYLNVPLDDRDAMYLGHFVYECEYAGIKYDMLGV